MPRFRYKAATPGGETVEGEVEAGSRDAAVANLQAAGYLPIRAVEIGAGAAGRGRSGRTARGKLAIFTRELATLLRAGLPLDQALQTLESLDEKSEIGNMVRRLRARLQQGAAFSGALAEEGAPFDRLYLNMVRAGEASGALETTLERLAEYLERAAALRATVISASIYPAILLALAAVSLVALLVFVIPQFTALLADAGQTLPLLSRIVFGASALLRGYGLWLAGAAAAGFWWWRRHAGDPRHTLQRDRRLLRLPLVGELILKLETARLARTLGTLLGSGVPILTAMQLAREVLGNRALALAAEQAGAALQRGGRLGQALAQSAVFPPLAVQLIQVGEETGRLDDMLLRLARMYEEDTRIATRRLLALLEPTLILGLGVMIALIVVATLLAVLSLNQLVL